MNIIANSSFNSDETNVGSSGEVDFPETDQEWIEILLFRPKFLTQNGFYSLFTIRIA